MSIIDRNKLKKAFEVGAIPSQEDFANLIDSFVHKEDSGFVSQEQGLRLSPKGENNKIITIFNNLSDLNEKWSLEKKKTQNNFSLNFLNKNKEVVLSLLEEKKVGVNTDSPKTTLEVNGSLSMKSRIGTFAAGKVPADGNWYIIVANLNDCKAFEIIAKAGKKGKGLYSMIHGIALSTFGKSNNKIKLTDASYGSFLNKIDLKWQGETFNYNLQIRTRLNYGENSFIKYHICSLWDEDFF